MLGYWLYLSPSEFVVLAGRNATVSTPASAKRFIAANSGMNERYENIFSPPNEADAATAARAAVKNVFTEFPMFCFLFVEKNIGKEKSSRPCKNSRSPRRLRKAARRQKLRRAKRGEARGFSTGRGNAISGRGNGVFAADGRPKARAKCRRPRCSRERRAFRTPISGRSRGRL